MPTHRVLQSVLHNFLGRYISRYNDFGGYWLFGLIVDSLPQKFELLGIAREATIAHKATQASIDAAKTFASVTFRDQLTKSGLRIESIRASSLTIERLPGECRGPVNAHICDGHAIRVEVSALLESGREYRSDRQIFVAPHNARIENKSDRVSQSSD
jgi:hypothetical protein